MPSNAKSKLPSGEKLLAELQQAIQRYLQDPALASNTINEPLVKAQEILPTILEKGIGLSSATEAKQVGNLVNQWLSNLKQAEIIQDPEKTKAMLQHFDNMLSIAIEKMSGLWIPGISAATQGAKSTLESVNELQKRITSEQEALEVASASSEFTEIFSDPDNPEDLRENVRLLEELIELKELEVGLQHQLKSAEALLSAYENNEKEITGRLYALELVESQEENIFAVLDNISIEDFEDWSQTYKALVNPDKTQQTENMVAAAASWLTAPAITAFRALATERMQERVRGLTLTQDSEAKQHIKSLAESAITNIKAQLEEVQESKKEVLGSLPYTVDGKPIQACETDKLKEVLAQSKQAIQAVKEAFQPDDTAHKKQSGPLKKQVQSFIKYCKKHLNPKKFFNAGKKGRDDTIEEIQTQGKGLRGSISEKFSAIKEKMHQLKNKSDTEQDTNPDNRTPPPTMNG